MDEVEEEVVFPAGDLFDGAFGDCDVARGEEVADAVVSGFAVDVLVVVVDRVERGLALGF